MQSHISSTFSVLGDEIREKQSEQNDKFTRECCVTKANLRESDLYINEGWDRPKTGRVKEPYANNKYSFRSGTFSVFEKRKPCCRSSEWSEKKRTKEERKVLMSLERQDCFYCDCNHCTAFYRQVLAKHKIPFMVENRSKPSAFTVQRQYHSRKSWKDEYGLKKGDRVVIDGRYSGKVMFIGPLNDNLVVSELHVGVKLDEPNPKFGTGQHNGKYYFEAPQGYGVFVKYEQISKIKPFDPTVEGGPNKKVLKNQSSLAWLYGQSLDEAEVREHAYLRSKNTSPKPTRASTDNKYGKLERQQNNLVKEWTNQFGQKHSEIMLNTLRKLTDALNEEEKRLEEEKRRAELERIETEQIQATNQLSKEKSGTETD